MKWLFGKKRPSRETGWFRSKRLKVNGPEFWGKFEVYVDENLHIAMFLPKADHSVHVLRGTMERATLHYTYSAAGKRTSAVTLFSDQIQWELTHTEIRFRGLRLPDERRRYLAEVTAAEPFVETMDQNWIDHKVGELQARMKAIEGEHAARALEALNPAQEIERFAQMVRTHEDQAFGMRLLISVYNRQLVPESEISPALVDTYPDLKTRETEALGTAKGLLKQVREDMTRVAELRDVAFPPLQGNPVQDEITVQAQVYVETYEQIFPGRNRGKFLAKQDLQRLAEEAQKKLAGLKVPYAIEDYLPRTRAKARVQAEEMQAKT